MEENGLHFGKQMRCFSNLSAFSFSDPGLIQAKILTWTIDEDRYMVSIIDNVDSEKDGLDGNEKSCGWSLITYV